MIIRQITPMVTLILLMVAFTSHATSVQVPQTGQTLCYGDGSPWGAIPCAGTGLDGDLQAGTPWPIPRFSDPGDGTIIDHLTGLAWLKNVSCNETPDGNITQTWPNALGWSNSLHS